MLTQQVVANRTELHLGATLGEQDCEVIWDSEQITQVLSRLLRDVLELWALVVHLHDADTGALPTKHLAIRSIKHFFGQASWP